MTKVFPFLGDTELEVIVAVSSVLLVASHLVLAFFVKEKILLATKCVSSFSCKKTHGIETYQGMQNPRFCKNSLIFGDRREAYHQ